MIKTKCLLGEKTAIFYPSDSTMNYLIVSSINDYYEFASDFIFY